MLFDVDVPDQGTAEDAESIRCTECHQPLYSEQSVAARVGPTCAAKVGRTVIASQLLSKKVRRSRRAAEAA